MSNLKKYLNNLLVFYATLNILSIHTMYKY